MNSGLERLLFVFIDMSGPLLLGYALKKYHLAGSGTINFLIECNIIGFVTSLAILSFWVLPLTSDLVILPLLGVFITIVPGVIGWLFFSGAYRDFLERGSYMLSAMLSNIGSMAGLCAFILYDEIGFAYVQLVALLQNFLLIIICFPIARYYRDRYEAQQARVKFTLNWRKMFLTWNQLGVIGMIIGIALNVQGVERPPVFDTVFQILMHGGTWLALVPVGYVMDLGGAHRYYGRLKSLLALRFVIVPLLFYAVCKPLFSDEPVLLNSMLLVGLTPGAINSVITAQLYKLNVDLPVANFIVTTVIFCLVIFPAFFLYLYFGGTF